MKYLIINADDFGYSSVFNEKILELIRSEKITSTTVMVNRITEKQKEQVDGLKKFVRSGKISVGLHCDFENSNFKDQINEQFDKFKNIFGFEPSHLDIHKKNSFPESVLAVSEFCKKLEIPSRNFGEHTKENKTTYGKLMGTEGLGVVKNFADIENWLKGLEEEKAYEIFFHPGVYDPDCKSSLNKDRERDVESILQLNELLPKYGITKINFKNL